MKICSVYDQKTEAYLPFFMMKTKGEAIRGFSEVVNTKDTQFNKYPADYTLFEIGEWEETTGQIKPHANKINLGNALEYKKEAPLYELPKEKIQAINKEAGN